MEIIKVLQIEKSMRVKEGFTMFFDEELTSQFLFTERTCPDTSFKFIKVFNSIPKDNSHNFLLGLEDRLKFCFAAPTPDRDTISQIALKESMIQVTMQMFWDRLNHLI